MMGERDLRSEVELRSDKRLGLILGWLVVMLGVWFVWPLGLLVWVGLSGAGVWWYGETVLAGLTGWIWRGALVLGVPFLLVGVWGWWAGVVVFEGLMPMPLWRAALYMGAGLAGVGGVVGLLVGVKRQEIGERLAEGG
ncbi:MAG TPA: hypothetical protein VLL52_24115 [Anaerolineae bacterium]|nr:hypothetical protein [Anaerolineae bacterium]